MHEKLHNIDGNIVKKKIMDKKFSNIFENVYFVNVFLI